MFCWGKSSEGQLGLGEIIEDEPVLCPRIVDDTYGTVSEIKDIVCGWEHSAVLKQDGVVYTCGSNENGQLGHHKDGSQNGLKLGFSRFATWPWETRASTLMRMKKR